MSQLLGAFRGGGGFHYLKEGISYLGFEGECAMKRDEL